MEKANANLKNIEIEGINLNPKFNEKDTNYYLEYEGYIEQLNIEAIPEDKKAKVEIINNENFNSTLHVVTIKVTAQDGITTKEYKITAKKAGENAEAPSGLEEYESNLEKINEEKQKEKTYLIVGVASISAIIIAFIIILKKTKKDIS